VRRVVAGEAHLFEELVFRHYNLVFGVCYGRTGNKEDSEDLVQEVFLSCFQSLAHIEDPAKLQHYLARSARNCAVNLMKRKSIGLKAHEAYQQNEPHDMSALRAQVQEEDATELREMLRRRLATLPDKSREVISLYYFNEMTTSEIALLLDVNEPAVRKRLEYGRNVLRVSLEREIKPAIQTPDERKKSIAVILGALPFSPIGLVDQSKPGTEAAAPILPPATPTIGGVKWLTISSALMIIGAILVPLFLRSFESQAPELQPPDQGHATVSVAESSEVINGENVSPPSEVPVIPTEDEPKLIGGLTTIQVGPPPAAVRDEQLQLLQDVGEALSTAHDVVVRIGGEASRGPGDLMFLEGNVISAVPMLAEMIESGEVVPLDGYLGDADFDKSDFFPNLWNGVSHDGKVWAIPVLVDSWALALNTRLITPALAEFESADWPAIFDITLDHAPAEPLVGIRFPAGLVWDTLFYARGGSYGSLNAAGSPAWQEAETDFHSLVLASKNLFQDSPIFFNDLPAAIVRDGTTNSTAFVNLSNESDAWITVAPKTNTPIPTAGYSVAAIRKTTPEKERAAWEYIKELLKPERMLRAARENHVTPFRESVAARIDDPNQQAFIRQVRNMKFSSPNKNLGDIGTKRADVLSSIVGD